MIELREIIIGVIIGGVLATIIFGITYLPGFLSDQTLPERHSVKFVSVNEYSFRDWALRLDENNLSLPHTGFFRSHFLSAPIQLKDVQIVDPDEKTRQIFGQFESLDSNTDLFGKFEGRLTEGEATKIKVELFSAKINNPDVSVNRVSGQIDITENITSHNIAGNLQIGSVNYGGLPFGATNLKFNGDMSLITADVTTQLSGHQGTTGEFKGVFQETHFLNISGFLNIESLPNLFGTLQTLASGSSSNTPEILEEISTLSIELRQDINAKNGDQAVKFDFITKQFGDGFKSAAILNKSKKDLQIGAIFRNYWLNEYPYDLKATTGETVTQGVMQLSFNQQADDTYGPLTTRLRNMSFERGDFALNNVNGVINYKSLSPLLIEEISLSAQEMILDEPLTNISINMKQQNNQILVSNLSGRWQQNDINLGIRHGGQGKLPDLLIEKEYSNIIDLTNILGLDFKFSAPIELSKTWRFNGSSYESKNLAFTNTEPGILTLNENIPELSNLYIEKMNLTLEDQKTALLNATGTNPLLYGKKPITIQTKLERFVDQR